MKIVVTKNSLKSDYNDLTEGCWEAIHSLQKILKDGYSLVVSLIQGKSPTAGIIYGNVKPNILGRTLIITKVLDISPEEVKAIRIQAKILISFLKQKMMSGLKNI